MTLLNTDNLRAVEERIPQLEQTYIDAVGMTVYELCCRAAGVPMKSLRERHAVKVGCVPITAGGGVIGNFAQVLATIVHEFACVEAFATEGTDVTGFQEALVRGADVIFMADDVTCMAVNMHTGAQSDNSEATGRVFASLLEHAAGGVRDCEVLVLGMGKVGRTAFDCLRESGARVLWHDTQPPSGVDLDWDARCPDWETRAFDYIVECTTSPEIVRARNVNDETIVAAPGVPFGVSKCACNKARLIINDELESGIVTMLCEVM